MDRRIIELTAEIVSAHAGNTQLTSEELYREIDTVYASLNALKSSTLIVVPEQPKQLTLKQAFKKDEVICMLCGKGGYKTLKRHLAMAHQLKPGEYRKQFGIPSAQKLAAKSYSESRRQLAIDKGLGEGLATYRADRKNVAAVPIVKVKAPVPAVKIKTPVPAIKMRAAVPAKAAKKK